jgi:dienelactone hydrolase
MKGRFHPELISSNEFNKMTFRVRRFLSLIAFLFIGSVGITAQDAEMTRHFDYDRTAPLNIKQIGVQRRANVTIYDITYDSPKGGVVPAYLVVPKGRGPFAAIIWGHWYWENSSMRNRREFLDEAIAMAPTGVVSLLTDGPIARPGYVKSKEPLSDQGPINLVQAVIDMRRGLDLLRSRRDVDPKRIAYVGHSYNAGVGAFLAGLDHRIKAFVLMAGSLSDEVNLKTKQFQDFRQKLGPEKADAYLKKYYWTDEGKYIAHAAPAFVFLQYGSRETFLNADRAREYITIVSEPKRLEIYDAEHNLNAEARRDRVHFLVKQLSLKPVPDSIIAAVPNLYQPPNPNE